jgi:hypothetical protein
MRAALRSRGGKSRRKRNIPRRASDFNLKQRARLIVSVAAPRGSLVRQGGDYELIVSGDVDFSGANAPQAEPIARSYSNGDFGAVRFDANGTLETEDGNQT